MRFVRFQSEGIPQLGVVEGGAVHALGTVTLEDALARGADLPALARRRLAGAPVRDPDTLDYLPPLQRPGKIVCVGLNYAEHTKESKYEQPAYPTVFPRFATSLLGHGQPIVRPRCSDSLDFEGEMAVVIGRRGRHIPLSRALEHVAGYSIFNDGSVREYQFKSPQWTVGKNFDATGGFGPVFVTADELPPGGRGLRLETRLNGKVMQSANTGQMIFDVATLVHVLSEAISWEPGDVIVSGTPSGVGWARDPKVIMRDGDVVEVTIEGLGTLRNPVRDEPPVA